MQAIEESKLEQQESVSLNHLQNQVQKSIDQKNVKNLNLMEMNPQKQKTPAKEEKKAEGGGGASPVMIRYESEQHYNKHQKMLTSFEDAECPSTRDCGQHLIQNQGIGGGGLGDSSRRQGKYGVAIPGIMQMSKRNKPVRRRVFLDELEGQEPVIQLLRH